VKARLETRYDPLPEGIIEVYAEVKVVTEYYNYFEVTEKEYEKLKSLTKEELLQIDTNKIDGRLLHSARKSQTYVADYKIRKN
jgi:hypothetical protein